MVFLTIWNGLFWKRGKSMFVRSARRCFYCRSLQQAMKLSHARGSICLMIITTSIMMNMATEIMEKNTDLTEVAVLTPNVTWLLVPTLYKFSISFVHSNSSNFSYSLALLCCIKLCVWGEWCALHFIAVALHFPNTLTPGSFTALLFVFFLFCYVCLFCFWISFYFFFFLFLYLYIVSCI